MGTQIGIGPNILGYKVRVSNGVEGTIEIIIYDENSFAPVLWVLGKLLDSEHTYLHKCYPGNLTFLEGPK